MWRDRLRPAGVAFASETDLNNIASLQVLETGIGIGGRGNLGIVGNEKSLQGTILAIHLNRTGLGVVNGPEFTDAGIRQQETGKISHQREGRRKDRPDDHQQNDLHIRENTAAGSAGKPITLPTSARSAAWSWLGKAAGSTTAVCHGKRISALCIPVQPGDPSQLEKMTAQLMQHVEPNFIC